MAKFQKALFKEAIRAYAYRLLIALVYTLLAFAVRTTNLQQGIATEFGALGMEPQTTRWGLWLAFTIGAIIVMLIRKWWGDVVIMLPMLAMVYFSFRYFLETHNQTAPTVYFVIFLLVGFILWARRFYESVS